MPCPELLFGAAVGIGVAVASGSPAGEPVRSGRFVVFECLRAAGLGGSDIGLLDRELGTLGYPPGLNSAYNDRRPSISRDGRYIAFDSDRLGGMGESDVYLYDRQNECLVEVPGINSKFDDWHPSISPDGRWIAVASYRPGGKGEADVWLYDRCVRCLVDLPNLNSAGWDANPCLSWEARYIGFESDGSNRAGGAGDVDVFVYDRQAEAAAPLPGLNTPGCDVDVSISSNGRYVVSESQREDGCYVRLYDRRTESLVDVPELGRLSSPPEPSISADGRYVVLVMAGRTKARSYSVALYDLQAASLLGLPKLSFVLGAPDLN